MSNSIVNTGADSVCVSLSQILNAASKIDIVLSDTQSVAQQFTRMPGSGKEYILDVAPDFDAPLQIGE
jgi:hypothetical protein